MDAEDFISLENAVTISIKHICYGIEEIKKLDGSPASYHVAFSFLASGFERLMKSIICFWEFKEKGCFPNVKRYGHNLKALKQKIIEICYKMDYKDKCVACVEDLDFFEHDDLLDKIIELLSIFGQKARYYDFDKISGNKIDYSNPYEIIEEIENEVVSKNSQLRELQFAEGRHNEFIEELNNELRKLFNRFARALCRLFTLGDLGEDATRMTGRISSFLFLTDAEL
ncbi:MAG: hypothetical protein J7K47_02920 [Thermoplasmata archaeon]|nr:hypothetical protein [Thermoplasmata archaeon]